jgi:hypothetical protein
MKMLRGESGPALMPVFHPGVQCWTLLKLIGSGCLTPYDFHVLFAARGYESDTGKTFLRAQQGLARI